MINGITDKDIKELSDSELRELVGKLCEATLHENKVDSICVKYGGNQDAPDGGVDVRVEASGEFQDDWAVPRSNTIFQVKKPSMPNASIKKEMKKDEEVKDCIKELVGVKGAYIIVSSADSLTDKSMKNRISCMKSIVKEVDENENIKVDFYDSKRISTWVNQFPALVIWVNDRLGKKTIGWKTYHNWSSPTEEEKEFIIDEKIFLHKNDFKKENEISIIDGINEIRKILSSERKVVRLAGLSGVGKTRLAQALFDEKIGDKALKKELVIYADVGLSPDPVPVTFIQEIIALKKRIILVIDNCDKELHNVLAKFCNHIDSQISLLTIEYDVKEDINIESYNYYLDTSSDETIRKVLKRDFDYISDKNIDTIVSCSDGNFRVAKYLALTIDKNSDIGTLKSEELFKRLFFQGNELNEKLLEVGRACSIFISFNIQYNEEDTNNEINIISEILGISAIELIKNVKELEKRQIIQKRGNMRALLPHALSNKLSGEIFSALPTEFIIEKIKNSKRLELSLFRRLRFHHDKEYSKSIAKYYLEKMDFENMSEHQIELIRYIKMILPEKVLYKIEQIRNNKFFNRNENHNFYEWVRILIDIAYEPLLFSRATKLLIEFARNEKENENYNSIRNELYKLFHIALSGTHAPIEIRMNIAKNLINDEDIIKRKIGLKLIEELLESSGFYGTAIYEYDSRRRDYGYFPKTIEEHKKWYGIVLTYCEELINKNIYNEEIKEIIANQFTNLVLSGIYEELENLVNKVLEKESWPQIWISIGVMKHYGKIPKKIIKRINNLQEKCVPKSIEDKIIVFLSKRRIFYWDIDDVTKREKRVAQELYNLGKEISLLEEEKIKQCLLKIDNTCSLTRIINFVKGLYENDKKNKIVYLLLDNINKENNNIYLIMVSHYIAFKNNDDENATNVLLDDILKSKKYSKYYPEIQFGYDLKEKDVERVKKSLNLKIAPIEKYYRIQFAILKLNIENIIEILNLFPDNREADVLKINILHNLFFSKKSEEKLRQYSRDFISKLKYNEIDSYGNNLEYELSEVIKYSFDEKNGKDEANIIFGKIAKILKDKFIVYSKYEKILDPLAKLYPIEFLNSILNCSDIDEDKILLFIKGYGYRESVLDFINEEVLIEWMEKNKKTKEVSSIITPYKYENECLHWKKISIYILKKYFDNKEIISNIIKGIYPTSWSEKYSSVLSRRMSLVDELKQATDSNLNLLGLELEQELNDEIHKIKLQEESNQERFNTFE